MEARTTPSGEQTGSLVMTLLDRRSSVPLAGARINCVWRGGRVSRLDADARGNFQTTLPQGVYDLVISAQGYLSLLVRGIGVLGGYNQHLTRGLIPGEGQTAEGEPATAIGGFVTDPAGRSATSPSMPIPRAVRTPIRPGPTRPVPTCCTASSRTCTT